MHTHVYVCMCVYMHTYTYVYTYTHMCISLSLYIYIYISISLSLSIYIYMNGPVASCPELGHERRADGDNNKEPPEGPKRALNVKITANTAALLPAESITT